jgi:cyclic pyranopterin phosphate synthase
LKDQFDRCINYLRISVTDRCNLRCIYCMPECGVEQKKHEDILSVEEVLEIARIAVEFGISKIRVTGGEPLVRKGIVHLCAGIAAIPGVQDLSITTNGVLLSAMAQDLKKAGVARVNISVDTLNPEKYAIITRKGKLSNVLDGIQAARDAGMFPIKLNVVLIGGFNDDEIDDFVEMTRNEELELRFIELMPIGEAANFGENAYISGDEVLRRVPSLIPAKDNGGVARLYKLPDGKGTVGLISPISRHFCQTCNRIRLTADGKLKPCLHSDQEIDLRGLHREALKEKFRQAIFQKPARHEELSAVSHSHAGRNMNQIGG